jgi:hypothetical protein
MLGGECSRDLYSSVSLLLFASPVNGVPEPTRETSSAFAMPCHGLPTQIHLPSRSDTQVPPGVEALGGKGKGVSSKAGRVESSQQPLSAFCSSVKQGL